MSRSHDRHITIFSQEGKLYQIEYALKSVAQAGILGICLRGKDTVCMVCQKKVSDKLMDPSSVTSMYAITPKIGCMALGSNPDAKSVVMEARQMAAKFKDQNGYDIPVHFLAQRVGKKAQIWTQHAGGRIMACTSHLCAIDDEKGAQLWKCDPSGHYFGWKACATGQKDQEGNNALEKIIKKTNAESDMVTTIRKAIDALAAVLGADLKPADIEVGVVTGAENFRILPDVEVDAHLDAIREQD